MFIHRPLSSTEPTRFVKFFSFFNKKKTTAVRPEPIVACDSPSASVPSVAASIPSLADFDLLRPLGKGATAKVFLVRHKKTLVHYALKVAPKTGKASIDLPFEQTMLRSASQDPSPFVLRLVASWHDTVNYYILTPWHEGGDLATLLMLGKPSRERAKSYAAQLILALQDLHGRRIIHRDVKPTNIFIDKAGNIVLGDLGFGKAFPLSKDSEEPDFVEFIADPNASSGSFHWDDCVTRERCGTPAFMAPEQHCGHEYSFDADVWGLGMVFFYMLTGRSPFLGTPRTAEEFSRTFQGAPVHFEDADDLDEEVRDVVLWFLAKNRRDRVLLEEIKSHTFFASIDWDTLATGTLPNPWASVPPPVPQIARPDLVKAGDPYEAGADPMPRFCYVDPTFIDRIVEPRANPMAALFHQLRDALTSTNAPPPPVAVVAAAPSPSVVAVKNSRPLLVFRIRPDAYPGFDFSSACPGDGDTDPTSDGENVGSLHSLPNTRQVSQSSEGSPRKPSSKRLSHIRHRAVLDGQQRPDLPRGRIQQLLDWARRCLRGRLAGMTQARCL